MTALARAAWPEVADQVGSGLRLVVPLGSCEQHGPHLPFDVDTSIAAAVAGALDGVVLGPALAYGASGEHEGFAGTLSIGTEALALLLVELGRSASRWASSVVFVTGHGGNAPALVRATRQLRSESRDVVWWPCTLAGADAHAGRTETSLALALLPERARPDRAEPGVTDPIRDLLPRLRVDGVAGVSANGVLGDPAGASASEGVALLEELVSSLRSALAAWRVGDDGRLLP